MRRIPLQQQFAHSNAFVGWNRCRWWCAAGYRYEAAEADGNAHFQSQWILIPHFLQQLNDRLLMNIYLHRGIRGGNKTASICDEIASFSRRRPRKNNVLFHNTWVPIQLQKVNMQKAYISLLPPPRLCRLDFEIFYITAWTFDLPRAWKCWWKKACAYLVFQCIGEIRNPIGPNIGGCGWFHNILAEYVYFSNALKNQMRVGFFLITE